MLQDKKWLTEALEASTVDEAKLMKDLGAILAMREVDDSEQQEAPSSGPATMATYSEKLQALDQLRDFVESMDNAKNLFVVGGYRPVLSCFAKSQSIQVRTAAALLISTVVQNNPKAQTWALHNGTLPALAATLALASGEFTKETRSEHDDASSPPPRYDVSDLSDSEAVAQANSSDVLPSPLTRPECEPATPWPVSQLKLWATTLLALSSLVRDSEDGQRELVASGTVNLLLLPLAQWRQLAAPSSSLPHAVSLQGLRLLRRCLFALRHLVEGTQADTVKDALLRFSGSSSTGLIGELSAMVSLGSLLLCEGEGAIDPEDADVSAIRDNALAVITSLASPSPVGVKGVVDDSDGRVISGMTVGADSGDDRAPTSRGVVERQPVEAQPAEPGQPSQITATTGALMLLPEPSSSAATASVPTPSGLAYLSLAERKAVLKSAQPVGPLQLPLVKVLGNHRNWCLKRAQEADAGQDGEAAADGLREEARLTEQAFRRILL